MRRSAKRGQAVNSANIVRQDRKAVEPSETYPEFCARLARERKKPANPPQPPVPMNFQAFAARILKLKAMGVSPYLPLEAKQ
jgi:hypothetical protein